MRKQLQKLFSFPAKTDSRLKKGRHKSKGQSLVEMTLTLPILLMLFSGLVEFGFMLNYYLSLVDATRFAARLYSQSTPFITTGASAGQDDTTGFYSGAANAVTGQLQPANQNDNTKKITLDPAHDDVIVWVYSVSGTTVVTYPATHGCSKDNAYHLYCKQKSSFTTAKLQSLLVSGAPCEGMVLVEVDYTYHQVLGLPWMAWLGSPVLHAYTIMPLITAQPGADFVSLAACS